MGGCPHGHGDIEERVHRGHPVRQCDRCAGLWLPARVVIVALGNRPRPARDARAIPKLARRCPDDGRALYAIRTQGIEIDVCVGCGGVWLDEGELERIVALRYDRATEPADPRRTQLQEQDVIESVLEVLGEILSGSIDLF